MMGLTVAAAPANEDWIGGVIGLGILALVGGGFAIRNVFDRRQARRAQELSAAAARERAMEQQSKQQDRDDRLYAQHVTLNDLHAKKLEIEVGLLQTQAENAELDRRVREQNEEYHRLMVQKAQLEIQSLKLHIREQQKRNEDFTSYDDE